ncbi:MAG: DUF1307 domain-containing protein [Erysipelotrichia bacterium]|nr:DUF1307 domain-containing protein [Erysipelotrichia bacterium]NCC54164.1 DUF1307 domain-containing protein [Erysipelotrichia bacterium]
MKKLIGVFLVSLLVISGCSNGSKKKSEKVNSVTCTTDVMEGAKLQYDLKYDNDKILTGFKVTGIQTSKEAISDADVEAAKEGVKSMYGEIDGVKTSFELSSDKKELSYSLDIDFGNYDFEKDELGMFGAVESKEDITKVNVKDMVKKFEEGDIKCGEVK